MSHMQIIRFFPIKINVLKTNFRFMLCVVLITIESIEVQVNLEIECAGHVSKMFCIIMLTSYDLKVDNRLYLLQYYVF